MISDVVGQERDSLRACVQWRIQDSWTGGADILLPPPAPPLLLSSLILPLIPPLFFLDVQARRGGGGWRTPSPHARSAPARGNDFTVLDADKK